MPSMHSDAHIYLSSPHLSPHKLQTYTSKYLLVISTCMCHSISNRKYPKRFPYLPSFCSPTKPHLSFLPISVKRHHHQLGCLWYNRETISNVSLSLTTPTYSVTRACWFYHLNIPLMFLSLSISPAPPKPHSSHSWATYYICFLIGLSVSIPVLLCFSIPFASFHHGECF